MRKFSIVFGFILVFFFNSFLAAEDKVNVVPDRAHSQPLITTDEEGNVYVLHYGDDEALYVIKNKGEVVAKLQREGSVGSFIWMGFPEGKPSIIWRPKVSSGAKFLYFQRAEDKSLKFGEEAVINNAKSALLPIDVAWKDRRVYISWSDERQSPQNVYMNYSTDGGRTFRKEDINMTPGYVSNMGTIVISDKGLYFFFIGRKAGEKTGKNIEGEGSKLYVRASEDGIQWSEAMPVAGFENWSPGIMKGVVTHEGPLVFWAGIKGIWYAYIDGDGKWQPRMIEKTKDMDVNRIEIKRARNGDMYMISSYKEKEQSTSKPSVYFFRSTDNGKIWSYPVRINHNTYDNTSARFPDLHVTEKGTIVAVWQDHRLIRGNIYMNYSTDGGKTWLSEDINLDDNPGKNNDVYPYITGYKDKVSVLIPRYKDDWVRGDLDLYLKEVRVHE